MRRAIRLDTADAALPSISVDLGPLDPLMGLSVLEDGGQLAGIEAWVSPPVPAPGAEGLRLALPLSPLSSGGATRAPGPVLAAALGQVAAAVPVALMPHRLARLAETTGFAARREAGWPDRLYLTASVLAFAYGDATAALEADGVEADAVLTPGGSAAGRLFSAAVRAGTDHETRARDIDTILAAVSATMRGYTVRRAG